MDIIRAKELLQILADGVNPLTGEVLPAEDSCNQPEIIRALNAVLAAISEKKPKNQPENAGTVLKAHRQMPAGRAHEHGHRE